MKCYLEECNREREEKYLLCKECRETYYGRREKSGSRLSVSEMQERVRNMGKEKENTKTAERFIQASFKIG